MPEKGNTAPRMSLKVGCWSNGVKADFRQQSQGIQPKDWEKKFLTIYHEFNQMLKDTGWKAIATNPKVPVEAQDPLVTLYNPKALEPTQEYQSGCFPQPHHKGGNQFRGAEVRFRQLTTGRDITIANLHLSFATLPQEAINEYQAGKIANSMPTVAIGDLNRTPNKGLASAIGDWRYATNVDAPTPQSRGPAAMLSTQDEFVNSRGSREQLSKSYDAALVNPGVNERAVTKETEMGYFLKRSDGSIGVDYTNVDQPHRSLCGLPWMRNRALLDILTGKARQLSDRASLTPQEDDQLMELRAHIAELRQNLHLP